MPPNLGLKGRLARMFLDFLDEHGDYRTQLEEAAARAAAASASSLLAKDREGRRKKRRRGRFGLGGDDDDEDEDDVDLLYQQQTPNPNQLPEDPYEQIQFYIRTFRQRTAEQLQEQLELTKLQVQNWMHDELHHPVRVPLFSLSLMILCALSLGWRKRRAKFQKVQRVHGILGKKFVAADYLHPHFVRGRLMGEYTSTGKLELDKLNDKARKAEEAALASMRPYQRKKYERLQKFEKVGERVVTVWLMVGMAASACCALISVGRLYGYFSEDNNSFMKNNDNEQLDGFIYSLDGPTDNDGYPTSIRNMAEENYAECLFEAESRGVADPTTECDVNAFFEAAAQQQREAENDVLLSPSRKKILDFFTNKTPLPHTLAFYMATLPTQTIAYLSSIFSFFLFLLSQYISHKIHMAALQNDPMKHFVATATDSTIKADGTVEAKKGETEAQRKRRERMLQQERYKAQMAQLAMEAKQRVEERRRRLEGEEAVKKEQEEVVAKQKEEMDETVKMHSRQFMMLKAGVPEGAILNSFLSEGIEEEEGKEILVKLNAIKAKRAEEARKAEEEEEIRRKKIVDEEKEKERIIAERLRLMRQGSVGSSSLKKPPQSLPRTMSQPSFVRQKTDGSAISATKTDSNTNFSRSLRKSLPITPTPAVQTCNEASSSPTSSIATASTTNTAMSPRIEDITISKGKVLGDIGQANLGLLRQTQARGSIGLKVISSEGPNPEGEEIDSTPLGTKKIWDKDSKTWVSTTPQKSNVTPAVKSNLIELRKDMDEEEKKGEEGENEISLARITGSDAIDLDESPIPPLLTRISSPSADVVGVELSSMLSNPLDSFETPSGWSRRPTARDIQAQIEAVEADDDDEDDDDDEEETIEHEAQDLHLGPNAFYSPGFDQAIRNSNASWDRRPSSRDIMARIKEAEQLESKLAEMEEDRKRAAMIRSRSANKLRGEQLGIISEDHNTEPTSSFEVRRKARPAGDDDSEISELSVTTYEENPLDLSRGRAIPHALFLRQDSGNAKVPYSPALTSSPGLGFLQSKGTHNEKAQQMLRMADKGELNIPPLPVIHSSNNLKGLNDESSRTVKSDNVSCSNAKSIDAVDASCKDEGKEETEEEKIRRQRAEKRAKKMEEMAAKRNAGVDDCASLSGLSKLRRRRKKKSENDEPSGIAQPEDVAGEETFKDEASADVAKEETEEDKLRRERAEKRAKKMEEMAAKRNAGKDDDTAVSGISKHLRLRRKKSALAAIAISAEDKAKNDWSSNIFKTVLNSEQTRWRRAVFCHVLNAEQTRESNVAMKRTIDEMDEQVQRIRESQKILEKRAKKFAAKAERFHKLREEGASNEDDNSVLSSTSRIRRRRTRKSTSKPLAAQAEETSNLLSEVPEDDEASFWCNQVFLHVLSADQNKWKTSLFESVLNSESKRALRREIEVLIESQRALAEARIEKEKQNELRAKKMDKIQQSRRAPDEENISPDAPSGGTAEGSSMKKMRDRRRKAALAKKTAQS